jgi:hypothetical protein
MSEILKNSSDENHEGNLYEVSRRLVPAPGTNDACTNGISATKLTADTAVSIMMIRQNSNACRDELVSPSEAE